jgi:sugar phosphate isomerase/epimerase
MKLSAMTLGCPNWSLETLLTNAREYGYDGVDFRGLQTEIDITKLPAFTTDLAKTARQIKDASLEVSGISSSIKVCDPAKRQENLDEAKRTIPVAVGLGAKNIRVFGGGPADKTPKPELAKVGAAMVNEILALPGAGQLSWNFETHDHWIKATDCKLLLDVVTNPAFGSLWDLGHTFRIGGESPETTYAAIGARVRYAHVKDAAFDPAHPLAMKKADPPGWRYVNPGEGQLPLAQSLNLLRKGGYDGWLLFEHEKRWHPDLLEPEVAFPAFIKWAKALLAKPAV